MLSDLYPTKVPPSRHMKIMQQVMGPGEIPLEDLRDLFSMEMKEITRNGKSNSYVI